MTVYASAYFSVASGLNVAGTTYSDSRLKTNIKTVSGALDKISRLKGVYYSWMGDKPTSIVESGTKRKIGLIAQDVKAVLPEVVSETGDGAYLGINYAAIVPLLVEGIKEMQASANDSDIFDVPDANKERIAELIKSIKSSIAFLEADNERIAKRIENMLTKVRQLPKRPKN